MSLENYLTEADLAALRDGSTEPLVKEDEDDS